MLLSALLLTSALAGDAEYEAECEAGEAASCVLLSLIASKSKDPAERAEAKGWFDKGAAILDGTCGKGDRLGCEQLADVWLVNGNPDRARAAWERACDLDPVACVSMADGMSTRAKVPESVPRVLLERACGHSVGLGCVGAAILGDEAKASATAVRALYDKGTGLLQGDCEHSQDPARRAQACSSLGELLYFGILQEADRDRGLDYWSRGCLSGVACRAQATMILAQGDKEGSIRLLRRACELGDCDHWEQTCAEATKTGPCAPLP